MIPTHFMLCTTDMTKSLDFYTNKMGLKLLDATDDWSELAFNDNLELALRKVDKVTTPGGIGFTVPDCEAATKEYEANGINMFKRCEKRKDNILTQFLDPDDNVIWLSEHINN